MQKEQWFHLDEHGIKAYASAFSWTGNYQENLCPVRDNESNYYHIDPDGKKIYEGSFLYCGDFKDGFCCVKRANGLFSHIDTNGGFLNGREFLDLDVFHKSFAMARDDRGWHHIDKYGNELYKNRYLFTEPFYNGYALVTMFDYEKIIIDEEGNQIVRI